MNLEKLFKYYKTDKSTHQYHRIYDSYLSKLRDKKLNILEIGVADGFSLIAWSKYFKNSKIIGIDIKKLKNNKLGKKISFHQGSQVDGKFLDSLIKKYKKFDIIIDDGSHYPADVIYSFKKLFSSLNIKGLYFVEDTQTSYNHFFGGNAFDLKYSNTHMNFFKSLVDSLNFKEIPNPFYKINKFDGLIKNVSFYNNMIVVKKDYNHIESNIVLNNSYENKRFQTKTKRNNKRFRYFLKYKILFKSYTLFLFFINLLKKIILFRY